MSMDPGRRGRSSSRLFPDEVVQKKEQAHHDDSSSDDSVTAQEYHKFQATPSRIRYKVKDENSLPMSTAPFVEMDKEIDSLAVTGCFGALYCWYWKERNIALLRESEHITSRLQSYLHANLEMKIRSVQAGNDQMAEAQIELLNTMRTEFKHATKFIQCFVRLFDLACMKFLEYIEVSDEVTVSRTLQKENEKIWRVTEEKKPFCEMLQIGVFKAIQNPEFDSLQEELLFGSIWQMPKIWHIRETDYHVRFPSVAAAPCIHAFDVCVREIPTITGTILDEMLPAFLQKMSLLQGIHRQHVDLGQSVQNKLLAATASTLFGTLTYLVQRQTSDRDVLPDLHLRDITQNYEKHAPHKVWVWVMLVAFAICICAAIIAALCTCLAQAQKHDAPVDLRRRPSTPKRASSTVNPSRPGSYTRMKI